MDSDRSGILLLLFFLIEYRSICLIKKYAFREIKPFYLFFVVILLGLSGGVYSRIRMCDREEIGILRVNDLQFWRIGKIVMYFFGLKL